MAFCGPLFTEIFTVIPFPVKLVFRVIAEIFFATVAVYESTFGLKSPKLIFGVNEIALTAAAAGIVDSLIRSVKVAIGVEVSAGSGNNLDA
jgi:hypothetical protein